MSYKKLLISNYSEVVNYLLEKYGPATCNYFTSKNCKIKNSKISRTKEGLICHHIKEDTISFLSKPEWAKCFSFEYQKRKNLVYCNYIEHLILHLIINRENPELSVQGIKFIYRDCNALFEHKKENQSWRVNCYNIIKKDLNEYIRILKKEVNNQIYDGKASKQELSQFDNKDLSRISKTILSNL